MPDLSACSVASCQNLSPNNDAAADSGSKRYHDQVLISGPAAFPHLTKSSYIGVISDFHIQSSQLLQLFAAPVTEEGIVFGSANLGWKYKEVKKELEELTGLDVEVGNDANVAALGEMWKGGGAGYKNLIMVTLGTGVGGGIIVGGKILTGSHGAGGEIGHLRVNPHETESCGCGGKGCLEQYASATGIVRLAKRKLEQETRNTILNRNDLSAKSVFDAVKADDSVAKEIAESFGNYLGRALANLAAVIDPSIFVIGGGVSKAGEILLEYVEKPFQENAFFANKDVKFALATLGNDAGICGAAKLVLDDFAE